MSTLLLGVVLVSLSQLAGPGVGSPLYDGVVPSQPYRWLQPPPGQLGGAQGTAVTIGVSRGENDLIAVATGEIPPQAQLFASPGGITLTPGASIVHVSIEPVPAPAPPPSGYIDGNVYRILVTDEEGVELSAPAEARVSIVFRSAQTGLATATLERFDGSSWLGQGSSSSGPGMFLAVVTSFGDFAVVAQGPSPYAGVPGTASSTTAGSSLPAQGSSGASSTPSSTPSTGPAGVGPGGGVSPSIFLIGAVVAVLVLAGSVFVGPRRASSRDRRL